MDIASLIGFLGAVGMIIGAMISGGVAPFIDVPSLLIVFGGTFAVITPAHYLCFWVALPPWGKRFFHQ